MNNDKEITYQIDDDSVMFYLGDVQIGGLIITVGYYDEICNEYHDSVNSFDGSIMRHFDLQKKIVNIEDIWVNRKFQGKGLFRDVLQMSMEILEEKYSQFILRACSDNDFPEDKLVEIYESVGFRPYQETAEDGTIMWKKI